MGTIGILAGMGPRSTAPFVDRVVTECQRQYGARYDDEFPPMMIYSLPVPMALDRPLEHEIVEKAITEGLQRLEGIGVDFIAMPCNTGHIFYPQLAASLSVPLLNMIDHAVEAVPESSRKVALLATRFTIESRIYQTALAANGELESRDLLVDEDIQKQVDELILEIKSSPHLTEARTRWHRLIKSLKADGADTVLLACTDLNPVAEPIDPSLTFVDATQMLAAAVVSHWRA